MFCKNCGKELADSAKFCSKCGKNLRDNIQVSRQKVGKHIFGTKKVVLLVSSIIVVMFSVIFVLKVLPVIRYCFLREYGTPKKQYEVAMEFFDFLDLRWRKAIRRYGEHTGTDLMLLIEKSADSGYMPAANKLAIAYETGGNIGDLMSYQVVLIPLDISKAVYYWQKIVKGEDAEDISLKKEAQEKLDFYLDAKSEPLGKESTEDTLKLGIMYLTGYGMEKDYEAAFDRFKKIAGEAPPQWKPRPRHEGLTFTLSLPDLFKERVYPRDPDTWAQYYIGYMYEYGLGVEKNIERASAWYQKCCDGDNVSDGRAHSRAAKVRLYFLHSND